MIDSRVRHLHYGIFTVNACHDILKQPLYGRIGLELARKRNTMVLLGYMRAMHCMLPPF